MIRIVLMTIGAVLTLMGLLLMVTPLPGSTLALAMGLAMLLCSSTYAARCLQLLRARFWVFDTGMRWVESRTGSAIGVALKRTGPLVSE